MHESNTLFYCAVTHFIHRRKLLVYLCLYLQWSLLFALSAYIPFMPRVSMREMLSSGPMLLLKIISQ